jgi:hypothetical protein
MVFERRRIGASGLMLSLNHFAAAPRIAPREQRGHGPCRRATVASVECDHELGHDVL